MDGLGLWMRWPSRDGTCVRYVRCMHVWHVLPCNAWRSANDQMGCVTDHNIGLELGSKCGRDVNRRGSTGAF